jgi:hypothetical protein
MRATGSRWTAILYKFCWLLTGMLLGILIWATSEKLVPRTAAPIRNVAEARPSAHITVNPADAHGIINALADALPGDIIDVPPGDYLGPLVLKNRVSVIGSLSQRSIVRSDPTSLTNGDVAVIASGVEKARVENLEILSDGTHPLRIGIAVSDSIIDIVNSKVSGAIEAGIRIDGKSEAKLMADVVSGNSGAGIEAKDHSMVRLNGNWVTNNGKVPGMPRAGLEIAPTVHLQAANNLFLKNGLDDLNTLPQNGRTQLQENNIFDLSAGRK